MRSSWKSVATARKATRVVHLEPAERLSFAALRGVDVMRRGRARCEAVVRAEASHPYANSGAHVRIARLELRNQAQPRACVMKPPEKG